MNLTKKAYKTIIRKLVKSIHDKAKGCDNDIELDVYGFVVAKIDELMKAHLEATPLWFGGNQTNPKRVKWCPTDTHETFDGTVISETDRIYVVIPDNSHPPTQNWDKRRCEVIELTTKQTDPISVKPANAANGPIKNDPRQYNLSLNLDQVVAITRMDKSKIEEVIELGLLKPCPSASWLFKFFDVVEYMKNEKSLLYIEKIKEPVEPRN